MPSSTKKHEHPQHVLKVTLPGTRELTSIGILETELPRARHRKTKTEQNRDNYEKHEAWANIFCLRPSGLPLYASLFATGPKGPTDGRGMLSDMMQMFALKNV